jgi:hypothetical protein
MGRQLPGQETWTRKGEKSEKPDDASHYRHYPAEDAPTVLRRFIENLRTLRWIPRVYGDGRYIDRCWGEEVHSSPPFLTFMDYFLDLEVGR